MAYLTAADFDPDSLNEACQGYDLGDVDPAKITAAIARLSQRLDDLCEDHFENENELALDLDSWASSRLILPKRCTSVTTVKLRDETGTLGAAQPVAAFRLHSSLYLGTSRRFGTDLDWLETVPLSTGLVDSTSAYLWPQGPQTVQVVGDFGWLAVPSDIKAALAQMVWDHFSAQAGALGRTEQLSANGETFRFVTVDIASGVYTGLRDVDAIIADYRRDTSVMVG